LGYRTGVIDESFDLSKEEARDYVSQAESLWEEMVGRELFVYDETADFTIDFVFDERQASANSEAEQRYILDERKEENELLLQTIESLQADYEQLSTAYETRVDQYETKLAAYNAEVQKHNDRGGAPAGVFADLEEERDELNTEAGELSDMVAKLNTLAAEINRLSERGNALVNEYNEDVSEYNEEFGFAREFTQGDYQGGNINVYKFSSEEELITVLAHEFGHALGIDHVEGTSSLMYYLLEDVHNWPTLTTDDLAAYREVCGEEDTVEQKVRRTVRELLAKL